MIEKQSINGRDAWIKVDTYPVQRANPNIIPTEYFTAAYYLQDPVAEEKAEIVKDDDGGLKLFESPVAALSFTRKKLETIFGSNTRIEGERSRDY